MATLNQNLDNGFSIKIDDGDMAEVERMLAGIKHGSRDAIRRSANKTATTVRSQVVKKVAKILYLTQTRIRENTYIYRANYKKLSATVRVKGAPIPLYDYHNPLQVKAGVKVTVRRGYRELEKGKFIATMKSGHIGVFERARRTTRRDAGNTWGVTSLPIHEQPGPSVPQVFRFNGMENSAKVGTDIFAKNLEHEVAYILSKYT